MPGQQLVDYSTTDGTIITDPRTVLPLGNWVSIAAINGGVVNTPHTQTGPATTFVAAIVLAAVFTGIFETAARVSWSDGTTAGTTSFTYTVKQGAAAGALAGGTGAAKFGGSAANAPGGAQAYATQNGTTAAGQVLNVDAAGGGGLTFEGGAIAGTQLHGDSAGTLTGLLTANGSGTQNFETGLLLVDSLGVSSGAKTPFTLGKPICFGLALSATAAHVITFASLQMFVRELPIS